LGYNWFFAPNQVAMGGLTGLAQVINALIPALPVGTLVIAMNIPLFLLGWKYIGGHLLISSLYSMAVSSVAIDAIDMLYTFPPQDPMLATLCGGAILGFSLGLVFSQGATTGGTDIVTRLLKLKLPWLNMGTIMLIPDLIIICLAAFMFGKMESALYGLVALFICTKVMDTVLYGMDTSKVAYIISERHEEIVGHIIKMDRGITVLHGHGAYSGREKQVLMVAFKQKEIVQIKEAVHETDPDAFMIVCDAHDVLGEGFRTYCKNDL
jgi:uncharacterized membrane-anchored protein YitT (DUF2179 family)